MTQRNTRRLARCFLPLAIAASCACADGDDRPGYAPPADPNDTPSAPPSTIVTNTAPNLPDDPLADEDIDMDLAAGGAAGAAGVGGSGVGGVGGIGGAGGSIGGFGGGAGNFGSVPTDDRGGSGGAGGVAGFAGEGGIGGSLGNLP
jgi:hypothetical protein